MPIGVVAGEKKARNPAPFQVHHRYHSQGVAAGGSALLDAINKGKVHLAKFILDADEMGVVNTRDFNGKTPLIRACYIKEEKTRARAIDLLIKKGADVNLQDDSGRTALSYACEMGRNDVVKILLKNNVDPEIPDNKGTTPLMYAAIEGNDTAVEVLVRSFRRFGFEVDKSDNDGFTALLLAAKYGNIECASILAMEGRANLTVKDPKMGMTAEELARQQGCSSPEVLPFSARASAKARLTGYYQCTPFPIDAGILPVSDKSGLLCGQHSPPVQRRLLKHENLSVDEVSNSIVSLTCTTPLTPDNLKYSPARSKRGSLPTIKYRSNSADMKGERINFTGGLNNRIDLLSRTSNQQDGLCEKDGQGERSMVDTFAAYEGATASDNAGFNSNITSTDSTNGSSVSPREIQSSDHQIYPIRQTIRQNRDTSSPSREKDERPNIVQRRITNISTGKISLEMAQEELTSQQKYSSRNSTNYFEDGSITDDCALLLLSHDKDEYGQREAPEQKRHLSDSDVVKG